MHSWFFCFCFRSWIRKWHIHLQFMVLKCNQAEFACSFDRQWNNKHFLEKIFCLFLFPWTNKWSAMHEKKKKKPKPYRMFIKNNFFSATNFNQIIVKSLKTNCVFWFLDTKCGYMWNIQRLRKYCHINSVKRKRSIEIFAWYEWIRWINMCQC